MENKNKEAVIEEEPRKLIEAVLVLNAPCNLNCKFCFNYGDLGQKPPGKPLSEAQLDVLIPRLNRNVSLLRLSSTGETLLYPHIDKLLGELSDSMDIHVLTNGTHLHKVADHFHKLNGICFSLHGDRKIHDYLVGREGAHDIVMQHIHNIVNDNSMDIVIAVNYVINKYNYESMEHIIPDLLDRGVGVIRISHMMFNPGNKNIDFELINGIDVENLIEIIAKLEKDERLIFFPPMTMEQVRKYYETDKHYIINPHRCRFFEESNATNEIKMLRISNDGDVGIACLPKIGNLFEQDFEEILSSDKLVRINDWYRKTVSQDEGLPKKCSRCCFNTDNILPKRES